MKKCFAVFAVAAMVLGLGLPAAAADGKALYDAKCAMCHGKDGVAKSMGKPARDFASADFQTLTADAIAKVVNDGKNKMPAYKEKLKADEIKAISDYVKTLAPAPAK